MHVVIYTASQDVAWILFAQIAVEAVAAAAANGENKVVAGVVELGDGR